MRRCFMGWFSRIEQPLVRAPVVSRVAGVRRRPAPARGGTDRFQEHARVLHAPLEARRAPDRSRSARRREPVRRRRRRARADSRHRGCFRPRASRTRSRSCSATPRLVEKYRDGVFVTLRLKSSMYHRFHAPCDARVREVVYVSGDTWNVNPIALEAHRAAVLQERARDHRARSRPSRPA